MTVEIGGGREGEKNKKTFFVLVSASDSVRLFQLRARRRCRFVVVVPHVWYSSRAAAGLGCCSFVPQRPRAFIQHQQ